MGTFNDCYIHARYCNTLFMPTLLLEVCTLWKFQNLGRYGSGCGKFQLMLGTGVTYICIIWTLILIKYANLYNNWYTGFICVRKRSTFLDSDRRLRRLSPGWNKNVQILYCLHRHGISWYVASQNAFVSLAMDVISSRPLVRPIYLDTRAKYLFVQTYLNIVTTVLEFLPPQGNRTITLGPRVPSYSVLSIILTTLIATL